MFFHSISILCSSRHISSISFDSPLRTPLRTDKHIGVFGYLFFNGLSYGNICFLYLIVMSFFWVLENLVLFRCLLLIRFYNILFCCLQVVSIKAIGIAIKLTIEGISQLAYPQTWIFVTVAVVCVITQLNYLNKVNIMLFILLEAHISYFMIDVLSINHNAFILFWIGNHYSLP